jgi:multidrug efflux system outer membrane protein
MSSGALPKQRRPTVEMMKRVVCLLGLSFGTARADVPSVRDPLLAPVPPPARVLRAWSEGAAILRSHSTDLTVALADVSRSEALSRGALAALLGTIRVDGSYSINGITNTVDAGFETAMGTEVVTTEQLPQRTYGTGNLTATIPVIAPRAWVAMNSTSIGQDVARASLLDVQRTLLRGLAATIIAAVASEKTAELSRASLVSALDRLDLVTRKKTLGGGTLLDVVRGQQDLEAARAQVVATSETLRQSREALGLALGLKDEVGVDSSLRLDAAVQEVLGSCRTLRDLSQRGDILAAAGRVGVAHQTVNDARAQFLPTASIQALGSTTNQALNPYPQTQWLLEGLVSWNIWDGGSRYADLRRGAAEELAADARLEQAKRNESIEVARALRAVKVAEATRQVAERETAFAVQQERLTRMAYETGQGTSLELIAAASVHRAQEINLALREYDVVNARLASIFARSSCTL